MRAILNILNTVSRALRSVQSVILIILVAALVVVNIAQIVGRFIFFYSLPWSEELSVYMFIAVILLAGSLSIKEDNEIKIDVIRFPNCKNKQLLLDIGRDVVSLVVIIALLYGSIQLVQHSIEFPQRSPSLKISLSVMFMLNPIGYGTMAFEKLLILLKRIMVLGGATDIQIVDDYINLDSYEQESVL